MARRRRNKATAEEANVLTALFAVAGTALATAATSSAMCTEGQGRLPRIAGAATLGLGGAAVGAALAQFLFT